MSTPTMGADDAGDGVVNNTGRRATPYRAVWRWHFYAGLFSAPVLVILAITGALYLFDHEIDGWLHRDLQRVEVAGTPATLADQEAAVLAAHPGASVRNALLPRAPDQATRFGITRADGSEAQVFVDPYTRTVRGLVDPGWSLMNIVRDLHGNLLTGEIGSHLVELTACWTLVMLATGLYLWWPRNWRRGAFVPRAGATGRAFWRDWHAIPSMFNALLVLFLVLTGLPWSAFWGTQFAKLGAQLPLIAPSPNFTSGPPASITGLPWTIQHHGTPQGSAVPQARIGHVEGSLARLDTATHGPGVKVSYPAQPGGVFLVSFVPARAQGQRTLYLDPADGRVLGDISWRDYSPTAKAIEWGVMTHMGRQYGLINQLIGVFVCLTLVGTVVAGIVLLWKRRPTGRLAAPEVKAGDRLPRFLLVTLVTMGVLFPLLGATLAVVALVDRYAARLSGRGQPAA
ncbi:MAG: PepSY domain-containing protein [Proteobacteria bacterium]|nr:PepSY domain-containing protein [Pseudomonadota bacterium]